MRPRRPRALLLRDTLAPELQAAIDALPEAFRQAVWLRDVEEFSYAEIAEMLIDSGRHRHVAHLARPAHVVRPAAVICGQSMPNCQFIDPLVTPFVDGELPDAERRVVDEHLRACPPCHSRVAAEQAVATLIRARAVGAEAAGARAAARTVPRPASRTQTPPRGRTGSTPASSPRRRARSPRVAPGRARLAPLRAGGIAGPGRRRRVRVSGDRPVGARAGRRAHGRPREVLRDEQRARHPVRRRRRSRARWRRASAGACICRRIRRAPGSSWSARGRASTARARSRTSCTATTGGRSRCSCCRTTSRAEQLVEVLGHEAAIWSVGDRTFVLVAREPRPEVERLAVVRPGVDALRSVQWLAVVGSGPAIELTEMR